MSRLAGIRGQGPAIGILSRALAEDRLASAYLFHGPSGVGKERAALALAIDVIAGGDEALAHRIESGHHPDVRVFRPRAEGNRNLQVELVRNEILPFAQFAPFEAGAAFVIFPEADVSFPEAHPEAANALLKTLEEPRPNVRFVLLAERPNRLLRTIRSRCQPLRFAPLPNAELERILDDHGVATESRPLAIALAAGRADRALELARSGAVDDLFDRALALHALTSGPKPGSYVEQAERLAKLDEEKRGLELEALALLHRDLVVGGLGDPSARLVFAHRADAIREASARGRAGRYAAREAAIRRTIDALDRNVNVQTTLDALLFELGRMA